MTFQWCIVWMIFLVLVAVSFYWYGYTTGEVDGYKRGYAKGRKDVNAHLDAYRKNGGWSV